MVRPQKVRSQQGKKQKPPQPGAEEEEEDDEEEEEDGSLPGCTLFIKNLNFNTTEETLREVSIHQEWGTLQAVMRAVHLLWVQHGSGGGQHTLPHTTPAVRGGWSTLQTCLKTVPQLLLW